MLLEIDTPSEDEAHTIFLTMNDRGLSLNSAEMLKAYIIQQVVESDRDSVNHAIQEFELNQFTGRYMLHMLARLTDFVNVRMGRASEFEKYVDRNPRTSYDIEHILPDDYNTYKDLFNDEEDFNINRRKIGNLILLTSDHNRSYQAMPFDQKVVHYLSDNILAQSLNQGAYQNNPKFLQLASAYGFKSYDVFDKNAIRERVQLYIRLQSPFGIQSRSRNLPEDGMMRLQLQSIAKMPGVLP